MDMRKLLIPGFSYAPPRNFELPAAVSVIFGGGERDEIAFPAGSTDDFFSAKLTDTVYFVSRSASGGERRDYAIDTSAGLVTRVSGGAGDPRFDFGAVEGAASAQRHALSNDLDGNKVRWAFSPREDGWLTAEYSNGGVTASYPDGTVKSAKSFAAAHVAEGVYFFYEAFGSHRATMLCDFGKVLAVGTVFSDKGAQLFGAWGKIL
ncbi:MAG: hypothetical protein LBJ84_04470 [Oscillospiraceae bacterium]|jgi:hypothetical protein|nr:hypothetical protein [Oscillospiraceae bacterium]